MGKIRIITCNRLCFPKTATKYQPSRMLLETPIRKWNLTLLSLNPDWSC